MKARARHTEGRRGQAGMARVPRHHPPQCHCNTLQAGLRARKRVVYPEAAPSRAVAQWRSAAPLLAYRCGGSAGIALESIPGAHRLPVSSRRTKVLRGHLKPAHYLRRHARLSIAMAAGPARERLTTRGVGAGGKRSVGAAPWSVGAQGVSFGGGVRWLDASACAGRSAATGRNRRGGAYPLTR